MKIVIDVLLHFIVLFYFIFIPCHVLSIMMFKCTLTKEQINHLKSKNQNQIPILSLLNKKKNLFAFG